MPSYVNSSIVETSSLRSSVYGPNNLRKLKGGTTFVNLANRKLYVRLG